MKESQEQNQETITRVIYKLLSISVLMIYAQNALAQRFLTDYDSTLFMRDTLPTVVRRFENLHFSGYIQPQFQVAQQKGAPSYNGGNFSQRSDNRFMLRRARIKLDYILPDKEESFPRALFSFQIDATERGVNVRDMFFRLYEPNSKNFSLTTGLFARPFGFEVNLSSAFRETPERGRASQILMPTERDLGAMFSYESQSSGRKPPLFRFDIGLFNGQGLSGTTEFDSYKDLITRWALKPLPLQKNVTLSAGLSLLRGGWEQPTRYRYEMAEQNGSAFFVVDSSVANISAKAPRHYYGGDAQLIFKHRWGKTEGRAEYWWGTQPGTSSTTSNPGTLPAAPTFIRNFDAAFFYFLQTIVNEKWEMMVKYDWYDPNTKVAADGIGKTGTNLTEADVRFNTLGVGLTRYFRGNYKVLVYYDIVRNEKTQLPEFQNDIKDNVFTLRLQLRF